MRRWPGVSLRRWRRNQGFARAANEGCRLSRGEWVLLLNPDVSVPADFLDHVLRLMEGAEPRAGVVGLQLRNSDGTLQYSSGPLPTFAGTLARLALPRHRRKYHAAVPVNRCQVPWVTGCCLLLRRECLRQVGGFDEEFFLYYEDVDFCRRAREHGWSVWYEPAIHATHHHPLHTRTVPSHLRLITRHALLTYSAKHWPDWQTRLLSRLVQLEARLRGAWARWRGDVTAAAHFGELQRMCGKFAAGRHDAARRRLLRVVRSLEAP
jgi:GT2 family glycosyltransferase